MEAKKLPKEIRSTVTNDVYRLTFVQQFTERGWRYVIHYLNVLRHECLFLVDSYKGWPYDEMYAQLAEDKCWEQV